MSEMNASHRLFVSDSHPRVRGVAGACAVAAAGLLLGRGVATAEEAQAAVPTIAADLNQIAKSSRNFPQFKDIPAVPGDIRPAAAWGRAADQVAAEGEALDQATGPETWTLTASESFAGKALAETGAMSAPVESTTPATEAFAKQIRARATPPPSPKR